LDLHLTHAKASTSSLEIKAAQRTAFQRFLSNENMNHDDLLEAHFLATAQRAEEVGSVLVVHDTTLCSFELTPGKPRKHMPTPSRKTQSFCWHPSLVLAADGSRAPLGLVASRPFAHLDALDDESLAYWKSIQGVFENESHRWAASALESEAMLSGVDDVIHVMDREGDDYAGLEALFAQDLRVVVRLAHDRVLIPARKGIARETIRDALARATWHSTTREVFLNARQDTNKGRKKEKEAALPRKARHAVVSVRSTHITLLNSGHSKSSVSEKMEVNVVEVLEREPPEGEEAIRWVLLTREDVGSEEACWQIVDWYRARWTVEEYFKALKTGTDYLKSQQQSAHALLNQLALKSIVAWQLLRMRFLAREESEEPAEVFFSATQLRVLHLSLPSVVPERPTMAQAMEGVIQMGGYVKKGRAAGWLIIGRGWDRLLRRTEGYELAQKDLHRRLDTA
jgi:hypothetical protein